MKKDNNEKLWKRNFLYFKLIKLFSYEKNINFKKNTFLSKKKKYGKMINIHPRLQPSSVWKISSLQIEDLNEK